MPRSTKLRSQVDYSRYGYLFVAPFIITFLVFQLYPILFTFQISMTDTAGWEKIYNHAFVALQNFQALFDPSNQICVNFWEAFKNTAILWTVNFLPQITLALLLANWFTDTRLRLRFQGGFKMLVFLPNTITAATVAVLFYALFDFPVAPVNNLLQQLGLLSEPFEFYRSVLASRGLISFIQFWMWYGYTMILMVAGILGINPELFEAGLVDGCASRQLFRRITLPLLKPILLYTLVTSMIGGLQMFDIPFLLTKGNPNNTTNTIARFIYQQAFTGTRNFNTAAAASVVLFFIIVVMSLILFLVMRDRDSGKERRG